MGPDVLERCRRGDPRAFEELVRDTHRQAYTLALRLVGDRHEAEDVTQEAYLRVFRSLRGFREEARFETWLYRIVTNAALTHLRKRGRFGELTPGPGDLDDAIASGAPSPEAVVDRDELERGLARLPVGMRVVVVLKDVYGLSAREIGEHLGIAEGAVKVRLHRGRRRLKELVYGQEEAVAHDA